MREKVLFVASIEKHLKHFHTPFLQWFQDQGYEVHTAASGENEIPGVNRHYDIPFSRSPYSAQNVRAYKRLRQIVEQNRYRLIHCHTPNASVLLRLAARRARRRGTVVVYTAHGFHFFDGAGALQGLLYRSIEKYVSRFTDAILTMNREDYQAVTRYRFPCRKVFFIKGMGVDPVRFQRPDAEQKRRLRTELGIPQDAFVLIYPGEYSRRKNQPMIFDAMKQLPDDCGHIHLLLPGTGAKEGEYREQIAAMGLQHRVRLLGFQPEVEKYIGAADLNVATSRQEGMPTHIVESFAMGLPCVATDTRGQSDIVSDGQNGFLVPLGDSALLADRIAALCRDRALYNTLSANAYALSLQYSKENILAEHVEIYGRLLHRGIDRETCMEIES